MEKGKAKQNFYASKTEAQETNRLIVRQQKTYIKPLLESLLVAYPSLLEISSVTCLTVAGMLT